MILVNFKIYKESFGDKAVRLAEICGKVAAKRKVEIYPVVSALDAYRIKKETGVKVFLQNCDEYWEGAKSGYVSPMQAKEIGVIGSLLNHSEHKAKPGTIKKMVKAWPTDFMVVVCIHSLGQMEGWAKNIKPDLIAFEPSNLIGNKDKSVASEKPEAIKKFVDHYKPTPVLVGAGIHNLEDVKVSIQLGAKGILVASDIIKADNPEKELDELASGFGV